MKSVAHITDIPHTQQLHCAVNFPHSPHHPPCDTDPLPHPHVSDHFFSFPCRHAPPIPPPPTKHIFLKTITIRACMMTTIKKFATLILPTRLALLVIACGDEPGPYRIGAEEDGVVLFSGLASSPDIANAL